MMNDLQHSFMREKRAGFTLIEVLIGVAIMACLMSLLMPGIQKIQDRAKVVACAGNLRTIGLCGLQYSAENDQKLPVIEPWPSDPVYAAEDNAKTILDALGPYGLTKKAVTCRVDVAGPNYLAREGSSYQWCPMANGQSLQAVKLNWANMAGDVKLSQLLVAFDYTNLHNEKSNVLFGDGHVAMATGD